MPIDGATTSLYRGLVEACPFCALGQRELLAENELAVAIADAYAVTPGHALVVTRAHVATWFDATREQQVAVLELVDEVRRVLAAGSGGGPDGYNIGVNVGAAAGQTVMHLHVHVIPRRVGDVDDPAGGVRLVIPERGNYRRPGFVPTARSAAGAEVGASSPLQAGVKGRAAPLSLGTHNDPFRSHVLPLFGRATRASIVAAFIADSGVNMLEGALSAMMARGGRVRILTGDYLHFTQARALRNLLAMRGGVVAAAEETESEGVDGEGARATGVGALELRVVEVARLSELAVATSFHPKAWIFTGGDTDAAFVGSSNLTRTALHDGVEWNLRIDRERDATGFDTVARAFETWWAEGRVPDEAWLEAYAERARESRAALPLAETDEERLDPPSPRDIQVEALDRLREGRAQGRDRAMVVMATGLGKTWLSAFDVAQFAEVETQAGKGFPRVLFLAHRVELLRQAAGTFHRLFPDVRLSWYAGGQADLSGDVVLASVQKLGRKENLDRLERRAFDYIVVDEVHHADAKTYRGILAHLEPAFRLGLTATPERADAGDVFGLFDDHVAFEADIGRGVAAGALVPFAYYGLKDVVDYVPWRGRARFDLDELSAAVQTDQRMERMWRGWEEHPGRRTLVFCCTIAHADFVAGWLSTRGVRAVSVHSGAGSADRFAAVEALSGGELEALCTVDLFNEGVDIPAIDRVVMLRPTESPVVFLQQLGRGLRTDPSSDKKKLTAIDFVGNHRVFLDRVRTLLSLVPASERASLRAYLERGGELAVDNGCSIELELEAIDLLRRMMPSGDRDLVLSMYRELRDSREARPTIGELYRLGLNPRTIQHEGGWFGLVRDEGDLTAEETAVLRDHGDWLFHLERDAGMQKSFKMVVLEALIEGDRLHEGMSTDELAERSLRILLRSPELMRDIEGVKQLGDVRAISDEKWRQYWRKNPIHFWTETKKGRRPWFRLEGEQRDQLVPIWSVADDLHPTFAEMTRELVDYRLARYRKGRREEDGSSQHGSFVCRVISNQRAPILKLPDRGRHPQVPFGATDVRLEDGQYWRFKFVKIACNVAHRVGRSQNELPDLLRRWFGPNAGRPGTAFEVRFTPAGGTWWVEPVDGAGAEVVPLAGRRMITAFPNLRAAAGLAGDAVYPLDDEAEQVALPARDRAPGDGAGVFAVRASGTSMEGWRSEIHSGDWLVAKWAQGAGIGAVVNRIVLVARGAPDEGQSFHIKRVLKRDHGYVFASDNPDVADSLATAEDTVVAIVVDHVRPEAMAPSPGTMLAEEEIAAAFGVGAAPSPPAERIDGHLFILLDENAGPRLTAPDRVQYDVADRRPAETAFVLARSRAEDGVGWRYCGVGRWLADESQWGIPEVDFATWRGCGPENGRSASRRLDAVWVEGAREVVARLLADPGEMSWVRSASTDKACRILGQAAQGGIRIDGGDSGGRPRTVSLVDIGWVLYARDQAVERGIALDEPLVNRLRYLAGTPKASTRYIDTAWAILLVGCSFDGAEN